jgi:hypothetical protein
MIERQLKTANEKHMVALASQRLCAGYWFGFTPSNEHDPIKRLPSTRSLETKR